MRTRFIAFATTVGMAGLAAASLAIATVPSGSSGGGVSAGGGGGGHAGGGGGGGAHFSGGGGHSGGGYTGGHFSGGTYRGGGGYGGYAVRSSFMTHGGYVAHGSYTGFSGHAARGGYRIIGTESAAVARAITSSRGSALPRAGGPARVTLALGPRTGSAATAMRLDHLDRISPRPGHPPGPKPPRNHPKHLAAAYVHSQESPQLTMPRLFCTSPYVTPRPGELYSPCLQPVKEPTARKTAVALPH